MVKSGLISLIAIVLLIGLAAGLSACANQPASASAILNQAFILEPGQTAVLKDEGLSIKFVEIVSDSRCPTGVQCIWAGEVSSLVEINYQNQKKEMVLKVLGSGEGEDLFTDYKITFSVEPYPEYGKELKAEDYRLHLTISKES
ncbi:MAG TPA: hypothetical protein DCM45_05740 [Clostridiales bacterium]|nr:hypothetical protein [Clostridiales bacterium]